VSFKPSYLLIVAGLALTGCGSADTPPPEEPGDIPRPCLQTPDPGPCNAMVQMYYFSEDTGRCHAFTWGGCGGTIPFESLKQCQALCEGKE